MSRQQQQQQQPAGAGYGSYAGYGGSSGQGGAARAAAGGQPTMTDRGDRSRHATNGNIDNGHGNGNGNGGGSRSGAATPVRPARSQRRPMGHSATPSAELRDFDFNRQQQPRQHQEAPPPPSLMSSSSSGGRLAQQQSQSQSQSQSKAQQQPKTVVGRAARLHQAIQQDEQRTGSRPGSRMSHHSLSDDEHDTSMQLDSELSPGSSSGGGRGQPPPAALGKALAAFSSAGTAAKMRKDDSRDSDRGGSGGGGGGKKSGSAGTPPSAAGGDGGARTRRGAVGVQGESARLRGGQQAAKVPSTPAFREMERVLAEVSSQWAELLPPSVREDRAAFSGQDTGDGDGDGDDVFDPVTLALSLVAPDSSPERFRAFLATKDALSRSLKSSIHSHYRAFDGSVSSYNGLLSNLASAQKNTTSMRNVLEEVRETLGKRRTELGVLEARRTELAEMDRILVNIETLKNVPDTLETLMSDKRFLPAAGLLVRSLKMVNKPDLVEIAATADLRGYFVSQEVLMLEYLTEELHSHLYLKSFYTDARWKAHAPGQTDLPTFFVENTATSIFDFSADTVNGNDGTIMVDGSTVPKKQTKLAQYLQRLSQKPAAGPSAEEAAIDEGVPLDALLNNTGASTSAAVGGEDASGIGASASSASVSGMARSGSMQGGLDRILGQASAGSKSNPEQDSFAYIESLVESLAHLGKLSFAMDSLLQRAPIEIYNLVEATVIEVDERNDPAQRSSLGLARLGAGISPKVLLSGAFTSSSTRAVAYSLLVRSSMGGSSLIADDAAGAASSMHGINTEILLDFFWTLFSKLDAVLQGFRVLHEVVQRIANRQGFKDAALTNRQGRLVYSLADIWKPIQVEIQALLHDYLIDEQGGAVSSRSPIASINETLKTGRPVRDTKRALFKFAETDGKASSRRIKPFEDALNKSLRQSVPGLVSSLAEGAPTVFSAGYTALSAASGSDGSGTAVAGKNGGPAAVTGRTHRMLVPPTAFQAEALVLPAMRFLERARTTLPEGIINTPADRAADPALQAQKRYSGLMDDETMEKLAPALAEWRKQHGGGGEAAAPAAAINAVEVAA